MYPEPLEPELDVWKEIERAFKFKGSEKE